MPPFPRFNMEQPVWLDFSEDIQVQMKLNCKIKEQEKTSFSEPLED